MSYHVVKIGISLYSLEYSSTLAPFTPEVPQGSILGPIFFFCFICCHWVLYFKNAIFLSTAIVAMSRSTSIKKMDHMTGAFGPLTPNFWSSVKNIGVTFKKNKLRPCSHGPKFRIICQSHTCNGHL